MPSRLAIGFALLLVFIAATAVPAAQPNVLVITCDDMSCDSVGAFGAKLQGVTPNMDRLASQGLRFNHAYVQVGNCMPSRNVMWSGKYPHNNGVEGFYQVPGAEWPHLVDLMKSAGYFTGIRHKVSHSTPYSPYAWDVDLDRADNRPHAKDPASYGDSARQGIAGAKAAGKPFCLVLNVADPHKPFYGMGNGDEAKQDPHTPTRIYTPEEVPVPGFLFDHPDVRLELAHYYSSVRRADDAVGEILKALDESGLQDETLVVFLSDHGMPLPFAKTGLWYHSVHTPLIIRWPGVTKPGAVDDEHLVSAVDLLPTLCDALGIETAKDFDGRSFLPLVKGQPQDGREFVFCEYNENAGGNRNPMRAVVSKTGWYIYSPWVDGKREFATATRGTITYRTMKKLAPNDPALAARLAEFERGVPEEFYAYREDPDARHNLINDPSAQSEIERHRAALADWMRRTGDHAIEPFSKRGDPAAAEAYMKLLDEQAAERRESKPRKARRANAAAAAESKPAPATGRGRETELIKLVPPAAIAAGAKITVQVEHHLPADLGEQPIQITLKQGQAGQRVDRKVVTAKGDGTVTAEFDVPAAPADGVVSFAAFVGQDYQTSKQHVTTKTQRVQ
jgi:N-sulfoglucosamine sulfohydrolase